MKKRYFVIFAFALIVVAIWYFRPKRQLLQQSKFLEMEETNEVQPTSSPVISTPHKPAQSPVIPTNTDSYLAWQEKRQEQRNEAGEKSHNEWKTPISFFGMVLDESNNAVAGANVHFSWTDLSPAGNSEWTTVSDAGGLFSLQNTTGKNLIVRVSKAGYYEYTPSGLAFNYAGENENFVPDQMNPVVFRLRKKGEGAELIKASFPGFAHIAQLRHDGSPVELNLYQGKQGTVGNGQLKLEFWRDISNKNAKVFDWKLQISVPGGGLTGTAEQFPFNAPENGYQSPITIEMSKNDPNWKGAINTNYYIRLSDGKYSRIQFTFLPYNGVFTVNSFLNPTGSRYLEPR